jgi:hypothetical protein
VLGFNAQMLFCLWAFWSEELPMDCFAAADIEVLMLITSRKGSIMATMLPDFLMLKISLPVQFKTNRTNRATRSTKLLWQSLAR